MLPDYNIELVVRVFEKYNFSIDLLREHKVPEEVISIIEKRRFFNERITKESFCLFIEGIIKSERLKLGFNKNNICDISILLENIFEKGRSIPFLKMTEKYPCLIYSSAFNECIEKWEESIDYVKANFPDLNTDKILYSHEFRKLQNICLKKSGVYKITRNNEVLYIGESKTLWSRMHDSISERFRFDPSGLSIQYVLLDSKEEARLWEGYFIHKLKPKLNKPKNSDYVSFKSIGDGSVIPVFSKEISLKYTPYMDYFIFKYNSELVIKKDECLQYSIYSGYENIWMK